MSRREVVSCDVCHREVWLSTSHGHRVALSVKLKGHNHEPREADICNLCMDKIGEAVRKELTPPPPRPPHPDTDPSSAALIEPMNQLISYAMPRGLVFGFGVIVGIGAAAITFMIVSLGSLP